ncbi:hypothetical protein DGG96_03610 [Legionella qingyii]|uniref:Uncharacterized protein n=1 Tax=Legionella qingyii TaxID=2184757 RepID=A0A317U6Z0_9GAMM|nr:hypothetical protein DGG96_03610 [Legionella qingyii]
MNYVKRRVAVNLIGYSVERVTAALLYAERPQTLKQVIVITRQGKRLLMTVDGLLRIIYERKTRVRASRKTIGVL